MVVINVCGSYFLLARNVGNVFVYYVAIMLCVTYLDVHIWLKLPYIYLQFHNVPRSRFGSPSPLLRTAGLVYSEGEDVEMFLTRWRCKLLQICRHLVSRHGIASLASWIFLLPGQSPLMVFCVDF